MKDINDLNPIWQQIICSLTGAASNRVILANQGRPMPGGTELSASYLLVRCAPMDGRPSTMPMYRRWNR